MNLQEDQQNAIASIVFDDILFECMTEIFFSVHKDQRVSSLPCQICHKYCRQYHWKQGLDVFGQNPSELVAAERYPCIQCEQLLVSSRYAPHLEKCMNMGRQAARRKPHTNLDDDDGSLDGGIFGAELGIGSDATGGEDSDKDSVTKDHTWTGSRVNGGAGKIKKPGAKRGRKRGSMASKLAGLGRGSPSKLQQDISSSSINRTPGKVKKLKLKKPTAVPSLATPE